MGRISGSWLGLIAILATACAPPSTAPVPTPTPPALVLGEFQDDYGNRFSITPQLWFHQPRARYHIVRWNSAGQYAIAQNDSVNIGQPNRWTRIDWMVLTGMAPYEWGFCLTAYDAPTAAAAEATPAAFRESPKTGCNGFPFSRMRRI